MEEISQLIQRSGLAKDIGMREEAINLLELAYQKYLNVFKLLDSDRQMVFRRSEFDLRLLETIDSLRQ